MKRFVVVLLLTCVALAFGAEIITSDTGLVHPWTSLKTDTAAFTFAIVSDRTGGMQPGVFDRALQKLTMLRPTFVMSVGDFIQGYSEDSLRIARQWAEIDSLVGILPMPLFFTPGNHDFGYKATRAAWKRRFGKDYYSFEFRKALFMCLNSEDSSGDNISSRQLAWVKKTLADHTGARWTFMFFHRPLWWSDQQAQFWTELWPVLQKRKVTVFVGHNHKYMVEDSMDNGSRFISLGTTGGGNDAKGWEDGTIDHLSLVTLASDGMHMANVAIDDIKPIDILTTTKKEISDSLQQKFSVTIPPPYQSLNAAAPFTTRLRIANGSPHAVRFTAAFAQNPYVASPGFLPIDTLLSSSTTIDMPLRLTKLASSLPGVVAPLRFNWRAAVSPNQRDTAVLLGSYGYWYDSLRNIARRSTKITVDGGLTEWGTLPVVCSRPQAILGDSLQWHGTSDCSFRFGLAYDDSFLYAAINVIDDSVYAVPGRLAWEQDGIEFRIDGRSDPARSNNSGNGEGSDFALIAVCPGKDLSDSTSQPFDAAELPPGTKTACVRSAKGYSAEFAVPVAWLNKQQGGAWKAVRLNIAIDDKDKRDERPVQIWWRPDWREKNSYAGSGTFVKL